jgi:hypothetical protein
MIRTSLALTIALAFSATAFAAPAMDARLKTRAVSLSKAQPKPFSEAEKLVFERASMSIGECGGGSGAD